MKWGEMTMPFRTISPDQVKGLKAGDAVDFSFYQGDDGFMLERITRKGGKP